jgi:hypothetical protein
LQKEPDDDGASKVDNCDGCVSDGNWSDWEEDEDKVENPVVCLFCETSSSFDEILSHMNDSHAFDFTRICVEMDFYQQVTYYLLYAACIGVTVRFFV